MRKIKIELQCKVPSWNYCDIDTPTANHRFSKEKCRFCVTTKQGSYCNLFDAKLISDANFVHKVPQCIKATAGYAISVDEPTIPQVDPKTFVTTTIKAYEKLIADLTKAGYTRAVAKEVALKDILNGN